jgi:hypothetical protein
MNLNNSPKFLCNQDKIERINTQFSGIFNKSVLADNVSHQFDQESESSTTSTITDNNEFTFHIPQVKSHKQNSSPKKEGISLSDYFKSLQM